MNTAHVACFGGWIERLKFESGKFTSFNKNKKPGLKQRRWGFLLDLRLDFFDANGWKKTCSPKIISRMDGGKMGDFTHDRVE